MKNYVKESDEGLILEVDIEYPKNLNDLHTQQNIHPDEDVFKTS